MSNFPINFDNDTTLPIVNNNLTEIGGEAINAVRDAVFNIEQYLGLGGDGTTSSISQRLGVSLNPDGTIKASAIASLGLVTLPITNSQIASNAEIPESKLKLDYRTSDLYNYIKDLSNGINTSLSWISATGIKLEPHLLGAVYRHTLNQIDVSNVSADFFKNKFRTFRNNTNSYAAIDDLNDEFLGHQFADGSPSVLPNLIITNNGSTYPATHAHLSSGIYLNTSRFATIPQTANDLQQFADYIDSASIFLLGTRIQNLYSNGISKESRSSNLIVDGYGQFIVPSTPVTAYLLNNGTNSTPFDSIDTGDDIIEFKPSASDIASNAFDAKFALVKIGDIIRVNYDGIEIAHLVKEKKYIQNSGNKKYVIRIDGKNYKYTTTASARIDKPLVNPNKFGVLSVSAANNNFNAKPSLIVGSPRGAMVLGVGFNPDLLDTQHYLLYLGLYPTGSAEDGYVILPGIDVTGNLGNTPGKYTLSSVVEATNDAFRKNGFNYRFVAFQHQGEFGIALADSYNNAAFSIFSAVVAPDGTYDLVGTGVAFPNNVVGIFPPSSTMTAPDPLGFGPYKSNFASPPYSASYGSPEAAQNPTKLFIPLRRNNFYVNGIEIEKFGTKVGQVLDGYGDGYWQATVLNKNIIPGVPPVGRVETTYRITQDLLSADLAIGKTIVVQPLGSTNVTNFGRFIIKDIGLSCAPNIWTDITVYDAVHATGVSPSTTLDVGSPVAIYFGDDSVSFNEESATDFTVVANRFKRHFEVYTNQFANTFTHERARINVTGADFNINESVPLRTYSELGKLNIVRVSPKLRGYQFGSVNKITLNMLSFNSSGNFSGYLCSYDGTNFTKSGPVTSGRIGQVTRFYDETNIDYIDIIFDLDTVVSIFTNKVIDFQLFPSLSLDNEIMLISTCQLNDLTKKITHLRDERQFGNTSEKDLTTSALNFIAMGERILHANGVIRGFDLENTTPDPNPSNNQIFMTGGTVLVNGKFIQVNHQTVSIPIIQELNSPTNSNINWAVCVNDKGEYQPIPLLDYDAFLNTPTNSLRAFTAFNPVNAAQYKLDASTFSDIVNKRKDLALLYIVSSVVTPPVGISPVSIVLSLTDVRRYVNDVDNNLPLKLTSSTSQGNFKTPVAILNWLNYNNNFNGTAIVKGADDFTGVINKPLNLDFTSEVVIDGQNNAILTMNEPVVLGSNLTLKNLRIIFKKGVSLSSGLENLMLDNCEIIVDNSFTVAAPTNNIIFDFNNSNNIKIKNCNFNVQYFVQSTGGAVFRLNNTNDFSIDNSIFECNFNYNPSTGVPGDFFIIKNSPLVEIENSSFDGNFSQFIRNTSSDNLLLRRLSITCSFNPSAGPAVYDATTDPLGIADGLSTITYSSPNLVNNGRASLLYSKVSSTLNNIVIDDVTFFSLSGSNRLSLINFELSTNSAILSNVFITNCKFTSVNTVAVTNDIRPAISIINIAPAVATTQQQPLLLNVNIENNYCNKNQSIIVSSELNGSGQMVYPGLVAQNCNIKNNTCGSIGYWVASASKVVNLPSQLTSLTDKESSLVIKNNNCHYIYSSDHLARYFLVARGTSGLNTYNTCFYPSGNVDIIGNSCNWIHTGISYEQNSSLKILHNKLSAYSTSYIDTFGDTAALAADAGLADANDYAIFVNSNKIVATSLQDPGEGNDAVCVISDNTTSTGYWITPVSGSSTKYYYTGGYIKCLPSNIISNNNLKGVGGTSLANALIWTSGKSNIITNNNIYRGAQNVDSYIQYGVQTHPIASTFKSYGLVTDNFFDSPIVGTHLFTEAAETAMIKAPLNWTAERNKNQTVNISIPITSQIYTWGPFGYESYNQNVWATSAPNIEGVVYKSPVFWIHDKSQIASPINLPAERFWGWQKDLNTILPNNVKIIQVQMGMRPFSSVVETPSLGGFDSSIRLFINKWSPTSNTTNLNYFLSPPTTLVGPFSAGQADSQLGADISGNTPFYQMTGAQINSSSNTITSTIDLRAINTSTGGSGTTDVTENYVTGQNYSINISLDVKFKNAVNIVVISGVPTPFYTTTDFYFSPIVVKYRW